ncbi:MAG: hypothetical protein AAB783_01170 [Patescibacteria group bacterium]
MDALGGSDDDELTPAPTPKNSHIDWEQVRGCLTLPLLAIPISIAVVEVLGEVVTDLGKRMIRYVGRKS